MRPVSVAGIGLFCPAGVGQDGAHGGRPGEVPGFRARAYVDNRKNLKLMSRAVQLGVSAVRLAVSDTPGFDEVPPDRRGMFVGATPVGGEITDLVPALDVATDDDGELDLKRFGDDGYRLIHPLWLVKGLSNNVLGFASAVHDLQGVNANYCDGDASGAIALSEGYAAVAEGRADVVVAGAADAWVGLEAVLAGRKAGEGAAFFVLRPARDGDRWTVGPGGERELADEEAVLGYLGAAATPVGVARALLRGEGVAAAGLAWRPA